MKRHLSFVESVGLCGGAMIGSGVFMTPGIILVSTCILSYAAFL